MTDKIEKKNETGLVKPATFELPEGISDFGLEDLRLANLFICHDQSNKAKDNGVMPGHLYDSMSYESWDSLKVIFVYQFNTRVLYGKKVGDALRCYSSDGKVPYFPKPIHPNCLECPEFIQPMGKIQETGKKYGDCDRTINLAAILPNIEQGDEKDWPFVVSFQRSNISTAKAIMNLILRKRQNIYSMIRNISVIELTGNKGRYKAFKVDEEDRISGPDSERAKYWMGFIKQMQQAQRLIVDMDQDVKDVTPADDDIPFG